MTQWTVKSNLRGVLERKCEAKGCERQIKEGFEEAKEPKRKETKKEEPKTDKAEKGPKKKRKQTENYAKVSSEPPPSPPIHRHRQEAQPEEAHGHVQDVVGHYFTSQSSALVGGQR